MCVSTCSSNFFYRYSYHSSFVCRYQNFITLKYWKGGWNITSSFPVYEGDEILISTNKGRVIRVAVKEIRTAGRNTQGVRIIKLSGEEKVVSAIKIDDNLI